MSKETDRMIRRMAKSEADRFAVNLDPTQMGFFDAAELRRSTKAERNELARLLTEWATRLKK